MSPHPLIKSEPPALAGGNHKSEPPALAGGSGLPYLHPKTRSLDPEMWNLDPERQSLDPERQYLDLERQYLDPEGRNLNPEKRNLDPEGPNLDPEGRNLDPEGRNLNPEKRNLDPEAGNLDPERSNLDPEGFYCDPRDHDFDVLGRNSAISVDFRHPQRPAGEASVHVSHPQPGCPSEHLAWGSRREMWVSRALNNLSPQSGRHEFIPLLWSFEVFKTRVTQSLRYGLPISSSASPIQTAA
jgi:hypothetical protein